MNASALNCSYICAHCLRARRLAGPPAFPSSAFGRHVNRFTTQSGPSQERQDDKYTSSRAPSGSQDDPGEEEGALTRRLREMSEDALETGGRSARKAVEEAGFSAELKAQLEQRIAAADFRTSEANLPTSASRHDRDLANAEAWTGTESIHDASLRMLNDAHKPLRLGRAPKAPGIQMPKSVDTGHKRNREQRGLRLANARDRSGLYASFKDDADLEAADREKRLQELKDRFEPGARAIVPGSIQGLTSLANQRIEDAIARGQFKNLPRGKGKHVERDYNASSPFIDTTEYFLNKIIQKQEIVPPWIEKQQELTSAASKFRSRLRAEWKRHAARMISSKGGSLQDQMRRAEAYAQAELITNPPKRKRETLATVDSKGHLSQISLSGELKMQAPPENSENYASLATEEIVAEKVTVEGKAEMPASRQPSPTHDSKVSHSIEIAVSTPTPTVAPAPYPFRDPDWERVESAYHIIAIKDLNDKCRSYNLQAPELAKRPYFSLERELNSCYADVAPQIAKAILDQARRPAQKMEAYGQRTSTNGLFENLVGSSVRIRDERTTKQYGFKQFWQDLWAEKPKSQY